jgi:nucleotide-binding universal stress UspA family protein
MDLIKTILVGLDLSDVDDTLIDHIILASQKTEIQKVYFLNVQKSLDLPDEVKEKYPGLLAPKDEQIKKIIIDKIESSPHGKLNAEYELKIVDGNPTEQLLKWAKIKEVDLLVLGKKLSFESSGISASKIAKLAPCSVFFIPEAMQNEPHYFVVPVDFSQPSKIALNQGINVGRFYNEAEIRCVHFYDIPSGYSTIGKSYEEFADIMKQNAVKEFEKFIATIETKNTEIKCDFVLSKSDNVAEEVFKYALKNQASGIIMGSRGRTLAASIILGSVAEKVLVINSHLPIFIAKDKNHNMGFFEALIDA